MPFLYEPLALLYIVGSFVSVLGDRYTMTGPRKKQLFSKRAETQNIPFNLSFAFCFSSPWQNSLQQMSKIIAKWTKCATNILLCAVKRTKVSCGRTNWYSVVLTPPFQYNFAQLEKLAALQIQACKRGVVGLF